MKDEERGVRMRRERERGGREREEGEREEREREREAKICSGIDFGAAHTF